jgi:signal transduction histidine kinase
MDGDGTIQITARPLDDTVALRILDHGPGIPADVREHLFEPFFSTKHRGTGVGLATARRIFEAHGGTIELECPPDGGTIAVITVPGGPG